MKWQIFSTLLLCWGCSLQIDRSYPSDQKVALLRRQSNYETIQIDLFDGKKDENMKVQTIAKLAKDKVIDIALKYLKSQSYDIDSINLDSGTVKTELQTVLLCKERYIPVLVSKSYDCDNETLLRRRLTIIIRNDSTIESINVDFDNKDMIDKLESEKYKITVELMDMEVKELTKDRDQMYNIILESAKEFFHKSGYTKFSIVPNANGAILQGVLGSNNITVTLCHHKPIDIHVLNITNHILAEDVQLKVLADIMNRAILTSLKISGY